MNKKCSINGCSLALDSFPLIYAKHGIHNPFVQFTYTPLVIGYCLAVCCYPAQLRIETIKLKKRGFAVPEDRLYWSFAG